MRGSTVDRVGRREGWRPLRRRYGERGGGSPRVLRGRGCGVEGRSFGGSNGVLGVIASTLGAASDSITDLVPSSTDNRRRRPNARPSTSAGLQHDTHRHIEQRSAVVHIALRVVLRLYAPSPDYLFLSRSPALFLTVSHSLSLSLSFPALASLVSLPPFSLALYSFVISPLAASAASYVASPCSSVLDLSGASRVHTVCTLSSAVGETASLCLFLLPSLSLALSAPKITEIA